MLTLVIDREPRWIAVAEGAEVLVKPMTQGVWLSARHSEAAAEARTAADHGAWTFSIAMEIALRVIVDWKGIGDEAGKPLPVTAEGIAALMQEQEPFNRFFDAYVAPWIGLTAEKKGSAPLSDGTPEGAQNTAETAGSPAPPAPGS